MKKIAILLSALVIVTILLFGPNASTPTVHAQATCLDAAGGPIPCPPTEAPTEPSTGGGNESEEENQDSGGGAQPGGGNPNPATVVTATPEPTSTPLPIALPEGDYLGSCTSENFTECKAQFECEDGLLVVKVDLYSDGGTKYDFYCYPHEEVPLLDLPFAIPAPGGSDENWDGFCIVRPGLTLEDCSDLFKAACDADGGDYQEEASEDGSSLFGRCENQSEAVPPAPTEAPAIASAPTDDGSSQGDNDWEDVCTFDSCLLLTAYCYWDGGTPEIVEDGSGNTGLHCSIPDEEEGAASPNWRPWVVIGGLAILIGLLLPAVQKIREAAARTSGRSRQTNIDLINKDDENTEASDYLLEIDGIKGESKAHIKKAVLHVRKAGKDQQEY